MSHYKPVDEYDHQELSQYIETETNLTLEQAVDQFGLDVMLLTSDETELKEFFDSDKEMFIETINDLVNSAKDNKLLLHSPVFTEALQYSYDKAQLDSRVRKDKRSDLTSILFRKEELLAGLKGLGRHMFNPVVQLNNPKARFVRSVLSFRGRPRKRIDWIQPQYRGIGDNHIKYIIIDTHGITNSELERVLPHLYLGENMKMYHPIIWKHIKDGDIQHLYFNSIDVGEEK